MKLSWAWLGQLNRLAAVPRLVIVTFTFLTIGVPDIVGVILFKFFGINIVLPRKLRFPIRDRLLHRQPNPF